MIIYFSHTKIEMIEKIEIHRIFFLQTNIENHRPFKKKDVPHRFLFAVHRFFFYVDHSFVNSILEIEWKWKTFAYQRIELTEWGYLSVCVELAAMQTCWVSALTNTIWLSHKQIACITANTRKTLKSHSANPSHKYYKIFFFLHWNLKYWFFFFFK